MMKVYGFIRMHGFIWDYLIKGFISEYQLKKEGNGIYAFIIKGSAVIEETELHEKDGFGIWNVSKLKIKASEPGTEILLMEVPMTLS
jgi:redox-sensitive bicupin YhaK (pirin superfamily)